MIRRLSVLAVLICLAGCRALMAQTAVVLVASTQSPISHVTADEARQLYLGIPFVIDGRKIKPVRNGADPMATEMFMQRVMYMSSEAYERQVQKRIRENKGAGPPLLVDPQQLLQALLDDPMAITYMIRNPAVGSLPVRIIGEM